MAQPNSAPTQIVNTSDEIDLLGEYYPWTLQKCRDSPGSH